MRRSRLRRATSARTAAANRQRVAAAEPGSAARRLEARLRVVDRRAGQLRARPRGRTAAGRLPCRRTCGRTGRRRPRRRRSSMSSTNAASGSASAATPSPASICWQNWWVVAIVAASNVGERVRPAAPAVGRPRRPGRRRGARARSSAPARAVAGSARARWAAAGARAPARAARVVASRPNVTSISSVERGHALGDVAGGQRGDRERLAGARAGFEHRGAGGQRPAAGRTAAGARAVGSSGGQHLRAASSGCPERDRASCPNRVRLAGPAVVAALGRRAAPASVRRRPQTLPCSASARSPARARCVPRHVAASASASAAARPRPGGPARSA